MTGGAPQGAPFSFDMMSEMSLGAALFFWVGAVLGSFLNVVAYRMPRGESIVFPGSRCPRCRKPIAFYDNIPVLSWLILRGRCRNCRRPISARYPAVEAFMAALSAGLWLRWSADPAWAAATVAAGAALVAVALIDWDTFLIPDELSLGLVGLGLLTAPLNPFFSAASWYGSVGRSFLGALIGFCLCWGIAAGGEWLFKKEAMGGGDVKLMAGIGACIGGVGAFDAMMVASFLGSIYGVSLMLRGTLKRSDPIPFGPFLSAAAVFSLFLRLPLGFPFVALP